MRAGTNSESLLPTALIEGASMLPPNQIHKDLTVRGEAVERVYGNYQSRRFIVNRRYQRKLVWTSDEKVKFIDSIISGYPVPIILLAERTGPTGNLYEIIDGMQRLNAIMGFLENEFSVDGAYFDLASMATTKQLVDNHIIEQKLPLMPRDLCVQVASYTLPLSIYEFSNPEEVDEVFRRINSGGRKLSRQELRIAGSTGHFANAVRVVASKVRGDVSSSDELPLNEMAKISITNKALTYGINVDSIFWIGQGVFTREQVRESRDEEIIADLLAYMLLDPKPSSRTEFLDDFFGFRDGDNSVQRFNQVEIATQQYTPESLIIDFSRVLDQMKLIFMAGNTNFGQLMFKSQPSRAPRYFQILFLALHELVVCSGQEISDMQGLLKLLRHSGDQITIPEGGRWSGENRRGLVNSFVGKIKEAFSPSGTYDPALVRWITQLQNILQQSYTEQVAYDFKQGFLRLDGTNAFDEGSFEKILKTLVAIANIKKGTKGYVIVGVADTVKDASRVKELFSVEPLLYERFYITGVEHEANVIGKSLDDFFNLLVAKIAQSPMSDDLKSYVLRHIKPVRYFDKTVIVLEATSQTDPSSYDNKFYVRKGTDVHEIKSPGYAELFRRWIAGL
ncbi:GmrSD restriction endonuclease domain-containing protein [Pseudomonas sp. PSPC2-3]|uniref:GmrSD restriction endonuclease domain-containing protein n=1 Tax=Pseudomonas sp. PSPC2-3 TaxID=2804561 RepID=UPI003CF3E829